MGFEEFLKLNESDFRDIVSVMSEQKKEELYKFLISRKTNNKSELAKVENVNYGALWIPGIFILLIIVKTVMKLMAGV